MDSAIFFLSTNIEKFVDNLISQNSKFIPSSDIENRQNSDLKTSVNIFQENFLKNFGILSSEFPKLILIICNIINEFSIQNNKLSGLQLDGERKNKSAESTLNSSHKMEKKYTVVKNQVKEAKIVMTHQQIRYEELLNTIKILKLEKERRELQIEDERKSYRQIVSDQNDLLAIKDDKRKEKNIETESNNKNMTDKSYDSQSFFTATGYKTYHENNHENNHENEKKDLSTNSNNNKSTNQITSDEEDIRILHETLEFVETLAEHATELENRYEEVLSEKRLLKKMCSG